MITMFQQAMMHYNNHARDYDMFVQECASDFTVVHRNVLDHMSELGIHLHDKEVFDFGAGQGRDLDYFEQVPGCCPTGYEPNDALRHIIHVRCPFTPCLDREEFMAEYWENQEHPTQYDVLWSSAVLQHLDPEEMTKFIIFAKNNVRPGGHLIATRRLTPYGDNDDRSFAPLLTNEPIPHWNDVNVFDDSAWITLVDDRRAVDTKRNVHFQTIILKRIK